MACCLSIKFVFILYEYSMPQIWSIHFVYYMCTYFSGIHILAELALSQLIHKYANILLNNELL